jgi:hypothetical protein
VDAIEGEAFALRARCLVEFASPLFGVLQAERTIYSVIRIVPDGKSEIGKRVGTAAATATVHSGKGPIFKGEVEIRGCPCSNEGVGTCGRWLAEKLAVGGVTEIEAMMASVGCKQERARDYGLGLKIRRGSLGRAFGMND